MTNSKLIWSFLAGGCLLAYGCGDAGVGAAELSTRQADNANADATPCESDLDCAPDEECEREHGSSFCKPHGGNDDVGDVQDDADDGGPDDPTADLVPCESDLDCAPDEECEREHGSSFCKPHGGNDDVGDAQDDADDDDGPADPNASVGDCASDLDCMAGEECEFEHGTSFCKPHGG